MTRRLELEIFKEGFFRELKHGVPDGPSLEDVRGQMPQDERERAAAYLDGGNVLAATGKGVDDYFQPGQSVGALELRTDGKWVWPSDLAYYVRKYGVAVSGELLDQMGKNAWTCPVLSPSEMESFVSAYLSTIRRPSRN